MMNESGFTAENEEAAAAESGRLTDKGGVTEEFPELAPLSDKFPTAEQLSEAVGRTRYRRRFLRVLYSTVSSLITVAALAVISSLLVLPVLRVTGSSMEPTLYNDELVLCRKIGNFECGDVVAFYYNNKILLKRIIAVSGDIVNITEDGTVYVNGEALDEPYVSEQALGECDIDLPYQVPDERLFVMGDQRATSIDSRSTAVGTVTEEAVVGKVVLCIWPFRDMKSL